MQSKKKKEQLGLTALYCRLSRDDGAEGDSIVKHCLKTGAIKPSACDTVIHIKTSVGKSVFFGILREHFSLRQDLSR